MVKRWKEKPDARSTKERLSSITALKMIVKQRADEKAQLGEWKTELMAVLASKISELQKAYGELVEAKYLEMDKQRRFFVGKIEALREELKELTKRRSESEKQVTRVWERNMEAASMIIEEKESSQTQNRGNKWSASTLANLNIKLQLEKQSYAMAVASKPAQAPEKPWTHVQRKVRKPSSH